MAEKLTVTIIVKKEVENIIEAKALLSLTKTKFADNPDITFSASLNARIENEESEVPE